MKTFFSLLWLTAAAVSALELRVPDQYQTIQAAVDAAKTNDIIRIAPGVYTEQVRISANKLTLIGQPGTILRATEGMSTFISPFPGVPYVGVQIMLIELSDVTVRGLTFEGERLAGRFVGEGALAGLFFMRSSGAVENCAFYGFRETTPGPEEARALMFRTFEEDDVTVRVVGGAFSDNYDAIFLKGSPTKKSIHATIENNTIIGPGPLATAWNYSGIAVDGGVGARIVGNTISGYSYIGTTADFDVSFGILASYQPAPFQFGTIQPLEIEGNTLRDNQMHISLTKADGSVVRNNRFQGSAPGILPLGLSVSGTNVTVANNQFEDMPEGIRLLGEHPLEDPLPNLGDILGFALNAQITSNRFCNVSIPINRQSPATATEQGTLQCPFPPPVLQISSAVLLTWPEFDEGYLVESASASAGPWNRSEAPTVTQNGRQTTTILTDRENRFFRLNKP